MYSLTAHLNRMPIEVRRQPRKLVLHLVFSNHSLPTAKLHLPILALLRLYLPQDVPLLHFDP